MLTVGEGVRTLVTEPGRLWAPAQFVHVALASDRAGVGMNAVVTRYDAATGEMDIVVGEDMAHGSGTFADWTITGSGMPTGLRQLGLPDAAGRANKLFAFDAQGESEVVDFPPANVVTYGGIAGTGSNPIRIGWNAFLSRLAIQVDDNSFSNAWPIDITGASPWEKVTGKPNTVAGYGITDMGSQSVNYAASSGSAGYAANAGAVSGVSGWAYSNQGYNPPYLWATAGDAQSQFLVQPGNLNVAHANSANTSSSASEANNAGHLGGQPPGYYLHNRGSLVRNVYENGILTALYCDIQGAGVVAWQVNLCDADLKMDIAPTEVDSLAKVRRIQFVGFRYRTDVTQTPIDDGRFHAIGVLAQDLQDIDDDWVLPRMEGGWLQPNTTTMLNGLGHALQQLDLIVHTQLHGQLHAHQKRIEDLEARLAAVERRLDRGEDT